MNIRDIQNALIESADLVALAVCRRNAPKSDMMTRRKLYESYPNDWLDYHIKRKNIQGIKAGAVTEDSEEYNNKYEKIQHIKGAQTFAKPRSRKTPFSQKHQS